MKIIKSIVYKAELSQAEARVLRDMLSRTGGDPAVTRRGIVDDMIDALDEVGVHWPPGPRDMLGAITFKEVKIDEV